MAEVVPNFQYPRSRVVGCNQTIDEGHVPLLFFQYPRSRVVGCNDGSAPGQEPQPEGDGADDSARARLGILRRRLELAELE